jgi:hypothetical protein
MQDLTSFDQWELNQVLGDELINGPNAGNEIRFDSRGHAPPCDDGSCAKRVYIATLVSYKAYLVIHRPLTAQELAMASQDRRDMPHDLGLYILDILAADPRFDLEPGGQPHAPGP